MPTALSFPTPTRTHQPFPLPPPFRPLSRKQPCSPLTLLKTTPLATIPRMSVISTATRALTVVTKSTTTLRFPELGPTTCLSSKPQQRSPVHTKLFIFLCRSVRCALIQTKRVVAGCEGRHSRRNIVRIGSAQEPEATPLLCWHRCPARHRRRNSAQPESERSR